MMYCTSTTYRILTLLIFGMAFVAHNAAAQDSAIEITVDGNDTGREYRGIGANSNTNARLLYDYPEPERSQVLDYLFKPGYGASLQILKAEINGGTNTTAGSEPSHMPKQDEVRCNRGYQWWLMKEAQKRNPDIIFYGQQWSAPGWLDGIWTRDNIDYHLSWLKCAEKHGLSIDYIGGWNEKGFDPGWFVELDKALKEEYPGVKIPAADNINQPDDNMQPSKWPVADSMAANPAFRKAVDQIAMHWPGGWRTKYRNARSYEVARELGTPMQMTNAGMGHDVGGPPNVRGINRMYIDGKFTSYLIWNSGEAYYANLPIGNSGIMQARWPWSGFYDVGKNIWAFAHTTQFTEPGWHYLDTGSKRLSDDKMTATIVSLADSAGQEYSMILEAMDLRRRDTLQIQLKNLPSKPLHVRTSDFFSSDTSDHFQPTGTIVPHNGRFRLVIRPGHVYSISTLDSHGKGGAKPRVKTAHEKLSLPYSEDFEGYDNQRGAMASLFTNLSGVFEVAPCTGRPGDCYRQTVSREPITWNKLGDMAPTIMVGDPRWNGNYTFKAKVRLETPGYVELIGRINGQRPWTPWLGGYHARIGTGGWQLYSEDPAFREKDTLAEGPAPIKAGRWHQLALHMNGERTAFIVNGDTLQTIESGHHRAGNVALHVNKWNNAQFDDVKIVPTEPSPEFVPTRQVSIAQVSSSGDFWMGWTFEPQKAVDSRPETRWHSESAPQPHSITLDLGKTRSIEGLWLRNRFDKTNGIITRYRVEASQDGRTFTTLAEGRWPESSAAQLAVWDQKAEVRYVRLVALETIGPHAHASEIRIIRDMP